MSILVDLAAALVPFEPTPASENADAASKSYLCNDSVWPDYPGFYIRDGARQQRRYPLMGWDRATTGLPCAFWPHQPSPPIVIDPPDSLPPVLLFHSRHDAATPYSGGRSMAHAMPGSGW